MCLLCRRNSNVEFMELNKRERETKGQRERTQSQRYDEFLSKKTRRREQTAYTICTTTRERESVCARKKIEYIHLLYL